MKRIFSPKRVICLMLAIFMFISSAFSASAAQADKEVKYLDWEAGEGYTFVAESQGLKMYADKETGLFKLVNTDGQEFYSVAQTLDNDTVTLPKNKNTYGSQIALELIYTEDFDLTGNIYYANSKVACVNRGNVEVKRMENGIRVEYNFEMYEIFIPVEYTLVNGKLSAKIITDEITEGKDAKIANIVLLPSLGAADATESGYIFVPDGTGAIMNFNSGAAENLYSARVYGNELVTMQEAFKLSNTETLRLPVYGICRPGKNAILANVVEGGATTRLDVTMGNSNYGHNLANFTMIYHDISFDQYTNIRRGKQNIYRLNNLGYTEDDYEVVYTFLDANNSDYSALARSYREYLIAEKGLTKNDAASLINLDTYGGLEVAANFLGFKYTKLLPLTSYEDLITVLDSLKALGIEDPAFRYIGWQSDGIFNSKVLTKSKLLSSLGGKSGWNKLQDYVEENNINAVYDADLLQYRKSGTNKAATTTFNKKAWQYQTNPSTYVQRITVDSWLLLKPNLIEKTADKYMKNLNDSVKNVSLSTVTNMIYSDFKPESGTYRTDTQKVLENTLKSFKEAGYNLNGESANAYAAPYLSTIYNAPCYSSSYKLFDREVPFYQMVFKGYVSMTTAPRQTEIRTDDNFLKAVETGSALLYNCLYENADEIRGTREENLYSSEYTLWQDAAAEHYKKYNSLYEKLLGKSIIRNYEVGNNVMATEFEGGITVIVNYNYEDANTANGVVSARAFKVIEGGNA